MGLKALLQTLFFIYLALPLSLADPHTAADFAIHSAISYSHSNIPPIARNLVPRSPTLAEPLPTSLTTTPSKTSTKTATTTINTSSPTSGTLIPLPPPQNDTSQTNNATRVSVHFRCAIDETFCSKVLSAVNAAAQEFIRVVNINVQILLNVHYFSFCERYCANDTYGWGAPTSQFTLPFDDGVDQNYIYPQTLAKQLALYSDSSVWAEYDVDIDLNHDAYLNAVDYESAKANGWNGTGVPPGGKYWFQGDPSIEDYQIDFEYIVLHELLHGVGFISSWGAYFYTNSSPFRSLIYGIFDDEYLQLVTPGLSWNVVEGSGAAFINGFQPTMIFDKYLVSTDETTTNHTVQRLLQNESFAMQNFCVQDNDAFIINFIRGFNNNTLSIDARSLFLSMSRENTLTFNFIAPSVPNSTYITNPYLAETYKNMTLATGSDVLGSNLEQYGRNNNRPGIAISHVAAKYASTPDFLMVNTYQTGVTLSELVNKTYSGLPSINYTETLANNTVVTLQYRSPIGPGILRILDSMGYSTVLTRTNYTTTGKPKVPKNQSRCTDSSSSTRLKNSPADSSSAYRLVPSSSFLCYGVWLTAAFPVFLNHMSFLFKFSFFCKTM